MCLSPSAHTLSPSLPWWTVLFFSPCLFVDLWGLTEGTNIDDATGEKGGGEGRDGGGGEAEGCESSSRRRLVGDRRDFLYRMRLRLFFREIKRRAGEKREDVRRKRSENRVKVRAGGQ